MNYFLELAPPRALSITSASGRLGVHLPPGALLRRAVGDCPASLDPARSLAASRIRLGEWAGRARHLLPAWLGDPRAAETAPTEEILP